MSYPPHGYRVSTGTRMRTGIANKPPTGYSRQQQTAMGMRPGSRAGYSQVGGALNSQITVPDRPVTQQGLGGMRTGTSRGPMRQVQDKSYSLGLLRGKIQELNTEIIRLTRELEKYQQENATYLTYEKRAQSMAAEIEELRGQLADYNTLIDKLNTDTEVDVILVDCKNLKRQNQLESRAIDAVFAEKQQKEAKLKELEASIMTEREAAENFVETMDEEAREKYQQLKSESEAVKMELEEQEKELETLNAKVQQMEEELDGSDLKQEAFRLNQQLSEALAKREEWRAKDKETPEHERERLLKQVKQDNQEIASLEKRMSELQEHMDHACEQLRQVEGDLEEAQGERAAKIKELKLKEQERKEFLDTFDKQRDTEKERIEGLETTILAVLEHISQAMVQSQALPSPGELQEMEEDLMLKQEEMKKATSTAETLETQNSKLKNDLLKVEELEGKISKELDTLRKDIDTMAEELETYNDLSRLQEEEDAKRQALEVEREELLRKREAVKLDTQGLQRTYDAEQSSLSQNDTYTQLGNLEKKWAYHELNNFAMKEFIATREVEGNYKQVAQEVCSLQLDYNTLLCQALAGATL